METVTVTVTAARARNYGKRAFTLAIGQACKDIGVYLVGRHGKRRAIVHGAPVALSMEAQRVLGALESGIVSDFSFTISLPEIVESWSRVFGASFDDVNDIGD